MSSSPSGSTPRTWTPPRGCVRGSPPRPGTGRWTSSAACAPRTPSRRDQAARLWEAVEELGEPDRTLFFRYYYEEASLKETALELGLSQTAAKQRLFRGRKKLKAMLSEGADD